MPINLLSFFFIIMRVAVFDSDWITKIVFDLGSGQNKLIDVEVYITKIRVLDEVMTLFSSVLSVFLQKH
jgi:hypothetical protein